MAEKTRSQLLEELETLQQRLAQRDRAMNRHKEAEVSAQRQLTEVHQQLENCRKELRQARKSATALMRGSQRAEQVSKSHADALALFCSASSDLVFRVSAEGKVTILGGSLSGLLGFTPEELQGRRLADLLEGKRASHIAAFLDSNTPGGPPTAQRWSWKTRGGKPVEMEVHCQAVFHPQTGDKEVVGIARPIAEPPLPRGWSESETWVASLVHELKQPLTAIANYASAGRALLESGQFDKADLIHALEQTAHQAERSGQLIKRLRHLGRAGQLQRESVQLIKLVQEALQLLEKEFRQAQVRVDFHPSEGIPAVTIDRMQVEQVLLNLLRNAIDALEKTPPLERVIGISLTVKDVEIEIAVSDNGEGLPLELVHRLFEPFQTTKPEGMGLGLALCRAIVQSHGGRLWVTPNADRGTSFHFTLPRL